MKPVRIGLLIAQQGSAGLWAPSAEACGRLAVHEINQNSGILKRHIELHVIDAGTTAESAAEAARHAVDERGVAGVVSMIPSYARESVARATSERVPLVYTPQFEGYARERNILTTGETAEELMTPALRWLMAQKNARRFFLCGNDYIWPRSSLKIARTFIERAGGIVTGELYTPVGVLDFDEMLDRIKTTCSDVVLPYFLGSDSIAFNRAFYEMGLSPSVLRFSSAIDETIVYGLSEDETENIFVASAYFSAMRSRNNGAFLERYHTAYGENPPPANAFGQSCYEGIYSLAAMVEEAGSFDVRLLKKVYGRVPLQKTARGNEARPAVGSRHPVHVARLDGYDFSILNGL
ncbi:MAG: amino acid ABC transporter [Shinella sp.]|nr:MAG: amino acid ABC transporter [Shinella sp.]